MPLFMLGNVVGLCMIPLGLPGIWVQFAAALLVTIFAQHLGWFVTLLVLVLALGGELVDFVFGLLSFKTTNASKLAPWTALAGGFVFGFFGFIIPVPIWIIGPLIGSVIMSFIGTFAGAIFGEMLHQRELAPALRVGAGAAFARACGIASKLWIGFIIFCFSMAGLIWDVFRT